MQSASKHVRTYFLQTCNVAKQDCKAAIQTSEFDAASRKAIAVLGERHHMLRGIEQRMVSGGDRIEDMEVLRRTGADERDNTPH